MKFGAIELYYREIIINVTHGQWILLVFQVQTAVMWPTALLSLWDQTQKYKGTQSYGYWKTVKYSGSSQIYHSQLLHQEKSLLYHQIQRYNLHYLNTQ